MRIKSNVLDTKLINTKWINTKLIDTKLNEKTLTKVAIVIAIIGTILLFLYTNLLEPKEIEINEVEIYPPGSYVKISGIINDLRITVNVYIVRICSSYSSNCINVHANKEFVSDVITKGGSLSAAGIIKEYKGHKYLEVKNEIDLEIW